MLHVSGLTVDLNWLIQLIITALVVVFGLLHVVKNTASKYFVVDDSSFGIDRRDMPGASRSDDSCFICGEFASKKCSGCKTILYCSQKCQGEHWRSGHNKKCNAKKTSNIGGKFRLALVPGGGISKTCKQSTKILFPYEEFVKYFNWDNPGFPPRGLLNCGNSCFANVVLQCLTYTRPLVAYLLDKGHRRECRKDDWCFLCEFQTHVERASQSTNAFSPVNVLSRLPYIGGNLGYGKQEDAHEFMRFAIDTMQSVCLYEFGGEKAVDASTQETTLIQHIFGGHLQSQVICTNCNKVSIQNENMMDLTVEIHGDAVSLEECLDQFTAKEWLDGENMYKCDGCNDYVTAWKRLTVRRAPNILTIALKRFQSGRFGKLNKRVTFPETLDLGPYMTEVVNGADIYKLYAVVVHVDMLNASYFGHYICYIKDFRGNWYRIDDCKVVSVELEEVLSQGAYMLLYSRMSVRTSFDNSTGTLKREQLVDLALEVDRCAPQSVRSIATSEANPVGVPGFLPTDRIFQSRNSGSEEETTATRSATPREDPLDVRMADPGSSVSDVGANDNEQSNLEDRDTLQEQTPASGSSEMPFNKSHNLKCESSSNSCIRDVDISSTGFAGEVSSISLPSQNGSCEKAEIPEGVCFASLSYGEETMSESEPANSNCLSISSPEPEMVISEMVSLAEGTSNKLEPVNSYGLSIPSLEPEIVISEMLLPRSKCTEGAPGKLGRESYSNGFIGESSRNCSTRDGNAFVESVENGSPCKLKQA